MAAKAKQAGGKKFDNANRGALFYNDKEGNENRPDMTGNVMIRPEDYEVGDDGLITVRLAAWAKNSEKVGDYLSINASPAQQK